MMKYIVVNILLLFLFSIDLNGQASHTCGTTLEEQKTTIDFIKKQRRNEGVAYSRNTLEEVPIKLHIIGAQSGAFAIDSSIVLEELALVNIAFEEMNIVFTQCEPINFIYSNAYVTFIKNTDEVICDIHDTDGAINVYIPPNIEKENGEGICGYAYNFDVKNRVFLDKGCASNSSTFIHEMGHAFSLMHTHDTSNGEELANGSNCSIAGDLLCDTPADPRLDNDIVNDDCVYTGTALDAQQNPYNPDTGNFMSYSRKACRDYFSSEQKMQMEAFYQEHEFLLGCFNAPTPTKDLVSSNMIQVFPNPSNASFFLKGLSGKVKIELMDTAGRSLFTEIFNVNTGTLEISDLHRFKSGIYFLGITANEQTITKKIIRL